MEALYALLGLVLGIALTEAYRRTLGNSGAHSRAGRGRGWGSTARSPRTGHDSRRFAAQDYYDR